MHRGPGDHGFLNDLSRIRRVRDVAYNIYFSARTPAGFSIPCPDKALPGAQVDTSSSVPSGAPVARYLYTRVLTEDRGSN